MHGNRHTGFAALLGVACVLLWGCGAGTPSTPEEFFAPWDSLQYLSSSGSDTLTILGDGAIEYRTGGKSAAGLVAASTLGDLRTAASKAAFGPWPQGEADAAVILISGNEPRGFSWTAEDQLSEGQRRLIALLDGIRIQARSEALGEGNERVEWVPTSRLMRGSHARVAVRDARIIRDADALLLAMRELVGEDRVVLPEVDFDSEMVLAVFAGEQPAGSEMEVGANASRTVAGYLQVPVRLLPAGGNCPGGQAIRPYEFVRLRKTNLEVFFLWDIVPIECP